MSDDRKVPSAAGSSAVDAFVRAAEHLNAALTEKQKKATWLFITWATSAETQARTSWKFAGPAKRSGLNRTSLWKAPEFAAAELEVEETPRGLDAAQKLDRQPDGDVKADEVRHRISRDDEGCLRAAGGENVCATDAGREARQL